MHLDSELATSLRAEPRRWLVTGSAGFIGSHLVETLLALDQHVVAVDDLSTGRRDNLALATGWATESRGTYRFVEGSIANISVASDVCSGCDVVLHQAAIGSVPRSVADPLRSHTANDTGTVTLLEAARQVGVKRVVYASSSSVYGDSTELPKREDRTGSVLSPYAATKAACELYAGVFERTYGIETVGLRYFNVFGPRQDPSGPYAAVIPRWMDALAQGQDCIIYGDGETSRDFCYIANVVQANLRAATVKLQASRVFNIAAGGRTTLLALHRLLQEGVAAHVPAAARTAVQMQGFRAGDIRHSHADVSRAQRELGYEPAFKVRQGVEELVRWWFRTNTR